MNVVLTPPAARGRVALSVLLVAEAMNLLDSTITTVASPVIRLDLHGSAADIAWVNAAYTLPFIGFRAAQGACAALVIPQTIGLIKAMFTGSALSMIGPVMGLAAVLGPVLGGTLTAAGVVLAAVACAGNRDGAYPWAMLAPLGLCGLGAGLVSVPFFTAALVTIALGGGVVAAFVTAAALVVAATVAATAMVTGGGDHEAR